MPPEPPRSPPEPYPRPADRERVTCFVQGAFLLAAIALFLAFMVWLVVTGS